MIRVIRDIQLNNNLQNTFPKTGYVKLEILPFLVLKMEWEVSDCLPYSPETIRVANRVTSSMSSSELRCKGTGNICKNQIF